MPPLEPHPSRLSGLSDISTSGHHLVKMYKMNKMYKMCKMYKMYKMCTDLRRNQCTEEWYRVSSWL